MTKLVKNGLGKWNPPLFVAHDRLTVAGKLVISLFSNSQGQLSPKYEVVTLFDGRMATAITGSSGNHENAPIRNRSVCVANRGSFCASVSVPMGRQDGPD